MNTSEFRYCEVVGEATGKLLGEPLDPRLISHTTDEEDGFKKSHLTGHTVIAQLNRIFGYGGHSWEVTSGPSPIGRGGVDQQTGEILVPQGYTCTGRLAVKTKSGPVSFDGVGVESLDTDGTFGAHDMAIKGAETDAMKRAARHLGTQFGLSLYFGGVTDMPAHFRANGEAPAKAEAAPAAREQGDNATRTQGSRPAAQSQSRGGDKSQSRRPAAQSQSRGNGGQKPKQNGDGQEQGSRPAAQSQSRGNDGQKPKQNGDGQEQGSRPAAQSQSRGNGGQKPLAPMPKLEQLSREEAEGLLIDYAKRQSDKVTAEVVRQQVLEHTGKPLAELEDAELRKMIASSYRKLRGR